MDEKKLSFEEAYKQLMELVKKMESGELPLADSSKLNFTSVINNPLDYLKHDTKIKLYFQLKIPQTGDFFSSFLGT